MEPLNVVGKRLAKLDAPEKATGQALYLQDIKLPGMLFGAILHSPFPHARILQIDTEKAEKVRGVKAVITAKDAGPVTIGPIIPDERILALDKVRYIGDEIAAVAALDNDTAEEAISLIKVDYEELPGVFDPEEAMKPGAPLIHQKENNIAEHYVIARGDVENGFAEADIILEDRFATPAVEHCTTEPNGCLASFDLSGKLTLWASVQDPFKIRHSLAHALNLPESKVRVVQPYVGGAFGGKEERRLQPICALLSRKAGRPVRLVNSRLEEFTSGKPRIPMVLEVKIGARADGTLAAKETRIIANNGAYSGTAPAILSNTATRVDCLYRYANLRTAVYLVYTNSVPYGGFRGFGNPQMHFACESMMDMIAEKLKMDPAELRLKNATQTGDVTAHGWIIRSSGLSDCIRKAREASAWLEKRGRRSRRGIGMACMVHVSGKRQSAEFYGSNALVKILEDGKAILISGEGDIGQGSDTVLAQMAAEELGLSLEDVQVLPVDTDVSPYCLGSFSSRVTFNAGNAVRAAATHARSQLFQVAAEMLEANAADLILEHGRISVQGSPKKAVTIAEVSRHAMCKRGGSPILGVGSYDPDSVVADPQTKYGNVSSAYPFAAQVAEVEVDTATGQVQILNFVAAHDLGKAINPMAAEGQVEGGISQGLGYALTEELVMENGRVINPSLMDYKILAAPDSPTILPILVETNDPLGPFGAKGVGEPALVPTAPAVANAIYDAIGVRIKELPITPERVLKYLKQRDRGEPM